MVDNDLITRLREHAEWAKANEWETPIMLGNDLDAAARIICYQETEIQAFRNSANGYKALSREWISVKDRLPATEDELLVLTMSKNGNVNVDKGYFANGRFVHRGRAEVTHWMPLPEPPEEVLRNRGIHQ